MISITAILSIVTATLIPIIYFVWQFTDRSNRTTDRLVSTSVTSALQTETNKNALLLLEKEIQASEERFENALKLLKQEIEYRNNMIDYQIGQIGGYLNRTTDFEFRSDDRPMKKKAPPGEGQ
jgi:hypothetical protein